MDLASITAGVAAAKAGFDTFRTAIGLVKDVQGVLPAGERKEVVSRTLEEAESQMRIAEAQIAQALGFPLCTCSFPPPVMLKVGWRYPASTEDRLMLQAVAKVGGPTATIPVHECPRCGEANVGAREWHRTPQKHSATEGVK